MSDVETERAVGYLAKRVQQAFRRRCDDALRAGGVSMSQYAVLRALADHPDASASELARLCFVTRQSLQDLLSGLRSAGLVTESATVRSGRARSLDLTSEGRKRLTSAHRAVMAVDESMTEGLSERARRELAASLVRCATNLEAEPSDPG